MTAPLHRPIKALGAAAVFLAAAPASALDLVAVYGGMAHGCSYDADANYRVITAYVDESGERPKLAHPDGGRSLSKALGRATFEDAGESYALTIPVADTKLYDMPLSRLTIYRGVHSDIAGVIVTFPYPPDAVRARLAKAGIKLEPHDYGWGDVAPTLVPADGGAATQLTCDFSM
ncbi:hypothetical protein MBSD_n1961 [Mizugakiibacter sediminis]|uniref:Uncharacterized protein n=1 Tax=Mizugakiibacter sediminis TaxID=1475481 RepID=A0A0K8QP43_9GAMM|nr:hypothetical protein [Mizugakiibacter sediminis]GAP66650.1 hypothetical protein MBSD_n1961 [Mizugakiibacter sediminis]